MLASALLTASSLESWNRPPGRLRILVELKVQKSHELTLTDGSEPGTLEAGLATNEAAQSCRRARQK